MPTSPRINLPAALIVALVATAAAADEAAAATFNVTNYSDASPPPPGSFRAAVASAVSTPLGAAPFHTIDFVTPGPGTIYPVAPFSLENKIRVLGRSKVTFDSSTDASGAVDTATLFEVTEDGELDMQELVVRGRLSQRGFYVGSGSWLSTYKVIISNFGNPEDHTPGFGGNVLCDALEPGPSWSDATGCSFSRSKISSGSAEYGGGVAALGMVSLTFTDSDVSYNTAWDAGGGVVFFGFGIDPISSFNVTRSSMYNNTAWREGGAIYSLGVRLLYLVNSTFSANWSDTAEEATLYIEDTADLRINHSTIVNGQPAGAGVGAELAVSYSQGYVANSILGSGGNAVGSVCALGPGNTLSFISSKIQDTSCGTAATANLGINAITTAACTYAPVGLLGCRVHPIQSTSPARNTGSPTYCTAGFGTNRDQRHYNRSGACDAGSYEYGGTP